MLAFPDTIHAKRFLLKVPANYAARIIDKKLNIYYKNPVLSVVFMDPELIDKFIARLESLVDVTDQSLKAE